MAETQITPRQTQTEDGWIPAKETWTYASASTITVPSGAASRYSKGDRIKWTQTTVKYGVIVSVADTVLTIAVNTDYTVANAAITNNYYSHQASPVGYPQWFAWSPTWSGFSTNPTGAFKYNILSNICTISYTDGGAGTSNSTATSFTVPVAPESSNSNAMLIAWKDNGSNSANPPGHLFLTGSSATVSAYKSFYQGAWTASGGKDIYFNLFSYRF